MKKGDNKGFTLIELIIVVTILAILVGLLSPQYTKYVEKARKAACDANIETIVHEYEVEQMEQSITNIAQANDVLKYIAVNSHNGTSEEKGTSINNGGEYSGFCKKNGIYSCLFTSDFTYVSINCSEHGDKYIDVKILNDRLNTIYFTDEDRKDWKGGALNYRTLKDYFAIKDTLDSDGKKTSGSDYGKEGSLAKVIERKLGEQGIVVSNRTWKMYKQKGKIYLILADKKVDKDTKKVNCQMYDIADGKVYNGEVTTSKSTVGDYYVLNTDFKSK